MNIQDQVFYLTKIEKVENYELALVLESYPLSRLVRLDKVRLCSKKFVMLFKVDKKKRIDISFYTEDSSQNVQREMVLEVKNYAKFLKFLDEHLKGINSCLNILKFNIE